MKKSGVVQVFWVGLSSLSAIAIGLVSSAILSRYLPKQDYGTYKQIIYVYTSLLVVFSAGLPKVYSFFLPRYSIGEGRTVVKKISMLLFLTGALFSIVLFLGSGVIADTLNNPELRDGLKWFSPIPVFLLPTLGIEGIFSSYDKNEYLVVYQTISRLLLLVSILVPVIFIHASYQYAIYGWIASSAAIYLFTVYFKNIPFSGHTPKKCDLGYKRIFEYSLPIVAASLAGVALRSADQFYISRYFGTIVFAEFSNGFISLPFVGMITSATSVVLMPRFSRLAHEGDKVSELIVLWKSALAKSGILIFPMVFFSLFNAKDIMIAIYSSEYVNSYPYFQVALFLNLVNIIVFAPLLMALNEVNYYSKLHVVFAIIKWIVLYVVVFLFPYPILVAVISVVITALMVVFAMNRVGKVLVVPVFELVPFQRLMIFTFHSLTVLLVLTFLEHTIPLNLNIWMNLLIKLIAFGLMLLASSPLFKVDYLGLIKPIVRKYL